MEESTFVFCHVSWKLFSGALDKLPLYDPFQLEQFFKVNLKNDPTKLFSGIDM